MRLNTVLHVIPFCVVARTPVVGEPGDSETVDNDDAAAADSDSDVGAAEADAGAVLVTGSVKR